ncbi:hypothetical protein [Dyella subtropica]|uniref:hypothetical protein n=1 Tax=Dyella subtropica TaxID=2992127 RepID=UPI002259CA37|nr:hypothetical protein [Dyella subtropica]
MRSTLFRHALIGFVALLALAACHNKEQEQAAQPGGETPEAAVQQSVTLIKTGDFAGFWKHALPPADYATLRTDWPRQRPDQRPLTDEDRADFNAKLKEFTEPGAEDKLFAQAKPKLTQLQQEYNDQLPVLIGIMQGIAHAGIQQSKDMSAAQKKQAADIVNVVAPWAQQVNWFDQAKAKQSIGVLVSTARKLDLKGADQLRAMDFDIAMQKYHIGFLGLKEVLGIYGLSVDDTLNSVKVSTLENAYGYAHVKIDYTLLGKPISTESTLVRLDDRWYSEDMLHNVREAHARLNEPAPASSAPTPATSTPVMTVHAPAPASSARPPAKR